MVAGGDDVHARGKDFIRGLRRDAVAAGGVLAVGDDEIERVAFSESRQQFSDGVAPGLPHDVANKKDLHRSNSNERSDIWNFKIRAVIHFRFAFLGALHCRGVMKTTRCLLIPVVLLHLAGYSARAHPADDTRVVVGEMAVAANNLLATLTSEQTARITYPLNDKERFNWHFIPRERNGLPFKEMAAEQKHLAHALLSTALSHRGYLKVSTIMSLEQVLRDLEQGK